MKMLRPRVRLWTGAITAGVATAIFLGFAYLADRSAGTDLRIPRVAAGPMLDGRADDVVWAAASPVRILTTRGANFPSGETTVEVRGVHDGQRVYFLFRWADPERSQKMLPLHKTAEGWRVLESRYSINDENEYYEDKFAVMLSHRPALGSGTAHLGQDLFAGPHYRNPRGVHYTEDGSLVDLWHWKSIRSGEMRPGFADDNYVGPPLPEAEPGARYTGGYTQDPTGLPHPYVTNHQQVGREGTDSAPRMTPRFLPRDPSLLERMGRVDLDPAASDDGQWVLYADEVVPYTADADSLPIGTVLPGIVLEGTFQGDRGDVRAEGEWADGHWTVEMSRLLDTGSSYDTAIGGERPTYLWVGVFNHAQTRHSRHLHPVQLRTE